MPQTSNKKKEPNSKSTLHLYCVNATPKRNSILLVSCEQLKPVWNSAGRIPEFCRQNSMPVSYEHGLREQTHACLRIYVHGLTV
jgi:hypothetical protein